MFGEMELNCVELEGFIDVLQCMKQKRGTNVFQCGKDMQHERLSFPNPDYIHNKRTCETISAFL